MIKMSEILDKGKFLLKQHRNLYSELTQIPKSREISFRIDMINGLKIGKPRFKNRYYLWPNELLTNLRDHLEDVWIFFNTYSHWIDETIMPIISYKNRRESKHSVFFLFETDVWETKEIFGDYLIEELDQKTIISYHRFNRKFKTFEISTIDSKEIEEWIKNDVLSQIVCQFEYLWSKIETEIKTCMREKYHKEPLLLLNSDYLLEQFNKTQSIVQDWPEAALLSLGRIIEMWLLNQLNRENNIFGNDLLKEAEINGIIDINEFKFFSKVRKEYNDLKHKRFFKANREAIYNFLSEFQKYIKF